jgi:hypothetical protein
MVLSKMADRSMTSWLTLMIREQYEKLLQDQHPFVFLTEEQKEKFTQ